jgi:peptide/nickel transport system permease protein
MVRVSPGFGLDEKQLDPTLSRQTQEAIRRAHTLGSSTVGFYAGCLKRMAEGDLGVSMALGRPVRELLAERAPVTLGLMGWGIAGAWALAGLLAVPASARRSAGFAAVCNSISGIPASLPAAGIAVVLFWLGAPARWTIALVMFPKIYQYLEGLLRQSYAMPHVLLARAKGLGRCRIFFRHVLLPARAQLLALAALSVNMAFGAAVAVEAITDLPGLGQLAWKAATARDLPVLVILTLLIALATQTANLIADVCSPAAGRRA